MTAAKRIMIITTTRADWGILSPLARMLATRNDVEVTVAAGNMHLLDKYGHTIDDIADDCYDRLIRLDAPLVDATPVGMTDIMAATAQSAVRAIVGHRPDAVVILGDRYEALGAATAAVFAGAPIVHLHGGEVTEGSVDDTVRTALSSMASLHLVATDGARRRLEAMGIDPGDIVRTGAIGVENVLTIDPMSANEISRSLGGFDIDPRRTLLVTYHPVTRDPEGRNPDGQLDALLDALDRADDINAIITYPNNDDGGDRIATRLRQYAADRTDRVKLVASLGMRRYISAMHHVMAVAGNTSSGILEAPSTPAYTIDIGPRQNGRERAASVIHVEANADDILEAIKCIQSSPRRKPRPEDNPYYRPEATRTAADAILNRI